MCRDVFVKVESIRVVPLFCLVLLVGVGWCREASYTNDWIVELEAEADPDVVAEAHGFHNKGKIGPLDNVYHFRHKTLEKRHSVHKRDITDTLNSHNQVKRSEQDQILDIVKRKHKENIDISNNVEAYNDPIWNQQWFINSEDSGVYEAYHYNIDVRGVWDKGYNGSGVVVCVVDDGVEKDHPDLKDNYDPEASWDLQDDDSDPSPRYAATEPNRHGTRCAGEIASARNNSVCGVGVAFGASIGGIRILDGPVTRTMESKALGHNIKHIDIFSASWGPPDNGRSMDGPKGITMLVIEQAIEKGRDGKGTIYVWAGGNGGKHDDCNADGYQNMRYSISISAVSMNGDTPYYSEPCANSLASTFSSGFVRGIATTDIHGDCTSRHSGTSAAAPIAAGIVAIALQANDKLTWRDIQHVIIRAAVPDKLYHHHGWVRNGASRSVHIYFGYGILDATRMVDIAKNWTLVEKDRQCQSPKLSYGRAIKPYSTEHFKIKYDGCKSTKDFIQAMEHVFLEIELTTERRGDISINITSPAKTTVQLISTRSYDTDNVGFINWRFSTVFLFGEDPTGTWMVSIKNNGKYIAELKTMFLDIFGTENAPIETNMPYQISDDDQICSELCDLVKNATYDSKSRCKDCFNTVLVDVERRKAIKDIFDRL